MQSTVKIVYITFNIGTENSADEDSRFRVAVDKATGGSYCVSTMCRGVL